MAVLWAHKDENFHIYMISFTDKKSLDCPHIIPRNEKTTALPGRLLLKSPCPAKNYTSGQTEFTPSYHAGSSYPFGSFLRRRLQPPPPKPQRSPPPPPSSINGWRRCDDEDDIQSLSNWFSPLRFSYRWWISKLPIRFGKWRLIPSGKLSNTNQSKSNAATENDF